jgi:hypothetical protein
LPTTIVKSASVSSLWMFRRGARSTMVAAACGATGRTFDWHLGDKAAVDTVFARTTKKKLNSIKLSFQHPFIWGVLV